MMSQQYDNETARIQLGDGVVNALDALTQANLNKTGPATPEEVEGACRSLNASEDRLRRGR